MKINSLILLILAATVARGCTRNQLVSSSPKTSTRSGIKCTTSKHCPTQKPHCVQNQCRQCRRDTDCNHRNPCSACTRPGLCQSIPGCCVVKNDIYISQKPLPRCQSGQLCRMKPAHLYGHCQASTFRTQQCPTGIKCPKYPSCLVDAHCRHQGEFCVSGACRACRNNADCRHVHPCLFCTKKTKVCRFPLGRCCISDRECSYPLRCRHLKKGQQTGICLRP